MTDDRETHTASSDLAAALAPTYVLGRELLGGGMSRVFVAEEPALGRTIVVKVLPPEWAAGMNRDRFLREIQLAARLQHPHIVPLLATGEALGSMYYTMPFIEGESLRAEIARGRRFGVREVARILHDVVEALAHAHARGIIHRDVKPGNVLMLGKNALVTDFGVAKALSAARGGGSEARFAPGTTSTGLAIGTPAYMAPEQLAADPAADHRVDLYAAGLLAYELLVGASPFTADSPQATLAAQLTRVPTPLHQVRPDVPAALSSLIERCLAKEPSQRPESADALLAELEALAYQLTPGGGTPADASSGVAGADALFTTPPGTPPVTAPLGTSPLGTSSLGTPAETAPLGTAAVGATATTVAMPVQRRRSTSMLGGALLGMGIVIAGGFALVKFGPRAPQPAPPVVAAPVAPPPAPLAAPKLSRDDSLAIAAAVERRFAAEERARRKATAPPLAKEQADSIRAAAWSQYADSVRGEVMRLTRGLGRVVVPTAPGMKSRGAPSQLMVGGAPDSATIAALAAAGVQGVASTLSHRFGPMSIPNVSVNVTRGDRPEAREMPERPESAERDEVAAAMLAKFGERAPAPKPGVRRVLVLDLADGTGRADLRALPNTLTQAMRRQIAAHAGYEVVEGSAVRDLVRMGIPESGLAAVTHSGAVLSGTVIGSRDSSASVLVMIYDARRGAPFSARTPKVPNDSLAIGLPERLDDPLVRALDRVRWEPKPKP